MHAEKVIKSTKERVTEYIFYLYRFVIILLLTCLFIPAVNPARICGLINPDMSLFTSAVSWSALTENTIRAVNLGWIQTSTFVILFVSSMITCLGTVGSIISGCMSLGSLKLRRLGNKIGIIGCIVSFIGFGGIFLAYTQVAATIKVEKVSPQFPMGFVFVLAVFILIMILSFILLSFQPKPGPKDVYELLQKYKLFLLMLPFIILTFLFSYLQLWGWRYAFFDYEAGSKLSWSKFVGFKWFTYLFENKSTRSDFFRVMTNTFAMSGLGLGFSWVSMVFAIFLCEIKSLRVRRIIQTLTTIPNFISWVLVYSVACVIFSSDGLISSLIVAHGGTEVNFLMSTHHIWLKMFAWGMWKGVGWSAIIYIAGISGIDQQLYEAATVDGAGRFQRMWNVTVPGLMPTFMVLLLLGIAGCLSNGLEQYLCFANPMNKDPIEVLDLYVYNVGIGSGKIPLSTVVGMFKSIVSVALLFGANKVSKAVRGESIV